MLCVRRSCATPHILYSHRNERESVFFESRPETRFNRNLLPKLTLNDNRWASPQKTYQKSKWEWRVSNELDRKSKKIACKE